MRKRISLLQMAVFFFTAQVAWAGNIKTEKVTLVGNGIVEFIPVGYDVSRTPSSILFPGSWERKVKYRKTGN